jgi:protein-S-isoprenylcysteine O-methyltransferase Ste14
MRALFDQVIPGLWIGWAILWAVASYDVKPTRRRESFASRLAHVGPLLVAALLLAAPSLPGGFLDGALWPATRFVRDLGASLVAAGLVFACWARFDLGRNWSGSVTLKQQHELVRSGPYRIVRHPIYAGLLLALVGTAIARAEVRGLLAVAIAFVALWRKLRLEEQWMDDNFGPEYQAYCKRVAALIPFLL